MEGQRLAMWKGKYLSQMTKEELIEALCETYATQERLQTQWRESIEMLRGKR